MRPDPEKLAKKIETDAKAAVSATGDQIEKTKHKLFEDMDALRKDPELAKAVNERLHKDAAADPSLPRVGAIVSPDGTVDALVFGPSVKDAYAHPDTASIIEEGLDPKGESLTHLPGNPLASKFMEKFYPKLIKRPTPPTNTA